MILHEQTFIDLLIITPCQAICQDQSLPPLPHLPPPPLPHLPPPPPPPQHFSGQSEREEELVHASLNLLPVLISIIMLWMQKKMAGFVVGQTVVH